jgi:mannose-6-phosphate isomerase
MAPGRWIRSAPTSQPIVRGAVFRLANTIQDYPWGSATVIPELLGVEPTGRPVAELWLGAHPSAPSRAAEDGTGLDRLVAQDPDRMLGRQVTQRFGAVLPYLLKVLAADRPLSLQVHPTPDQARARYAAEDAAGIPLSAPNRSYKDRNHKPELLLALTPFEAMCGFRPAREAEALLTGLDAPLARELVMILQSQASAQAIPGAVQRLLAADVRPSAREVAAVADACRARAATDSPDPRADQVVGQLADAYPGDPGVVMSLLLNQVTLQPGDAMFVPDGAVHAYLRGVGVEVMAGSDNVLRAGLTTKHVDVTELLATIDYTATPAMRVAPEVVGEGTLVFRPPAAEFTLCVATIAADGARAVPGKGPRILLCLDGEVNVRTASGQAEALSRGGSVFVPSADGAVSVEGHGTLVQADVP